MLKIRAAKIRLYFGTPKSRDVFYVPEPATEMPLVPYHPVPGTVRSALWRKTETLEVLFNEHSFLSGKKGEMEAIALEKRRWEWACTQVLKHSLGMSEEVLFYQNGKPYLASDRHISISHGAGLAGVITGDTPMGIDIQLPDPKLAIISKRFCHPDELKDVKQAGDPLGYLTTLWSAKEAIFKIFGEHVHFSEDIRIQPFAPGDRTLQATIRRNGVDLFPGVQRDIIDSHHVVVAWLRNGNAFSGV